MKKGTNQFPSKIWLAVSDVLVVNLAFLLAYWIRYSLGVFGEVAEPNYVKIREYWAAQIFLSLILFIAYALGGLYRRPLRAPFADEGVSILATTSIGITLTLALVYLYRGLAYSRGVFLIAWFLIILLLALSRMLWRLLLAELRRRGFAVQRVLVVGGDHLGKRVMHVIATEPNLGYQLVGFVQEEAGEDLGRFPFLGRMKDLDQVVANYDVNELIIALPSSQHHKIVEIAEHCRRQSLAFKLVIVPDIYELSLGGINVDDLRGIPVIGVKEVSIKGINLMIKRVIDLAVASTLFILLAPLWLILSIAIKLDSPGPALFKQVRIGKGGRAFQAYKFRSMKNTAEADLPELRALNEADGPLFKIKNDPRVTRVGHFLRRTSLDEMPQLINVLKGEMSLVGPRPPLPSEVEQYEIWHRKRLETAPGLTGLWQVSGRSDLPFDEMVLLDIYYIENWSLALDLRILLRTVPAILIGQGAY
ncbi:MAG: sugar transferase [Chloroflexi bacterium]|nr:sugar transferase [Chloroflexota bacterium]